MTDKSILSQIPRCILHIGFDWWDDQRGNIANIVRNQEMINVWKNILNIEPRVDFYSESTQERFSLFFGSEDILSQNFTNREIACAVVFYHIFLRLEYGPHHQNVADVNALMKPYKETLDGCAYILQNNVFTGDYAAVKTAAETLMTFCKSRIHRAAINDSPVILDRRGKSLESDAMRVFVRDTASNTKYIYGNCLYGTLSKITSIAFDLKEGEINEKTIEKWCTTAPLRSGI